MGGGVYVHRKGLCQDEALTKQVMKRMKAQSLADLVKLSGRLGADRRRA